MWFDASRQLSLAIRDADQNDSRLSPRNVRSRRNVQSQRQLPQTYSHEPPSYDAVQGVAPPRYDTLPGISNPVMDTRETLTSASSDFALPSYEKAIEEPGRCTHMSETRF